MLLARGGGVLAECRSNLAGLRAVVCIVKAPSLLFSAFLMLKDKRSKLKGRCDLQRAPLACLLSPQASNLTPENMIERKSVLSQ